MNATLIVISTIFDVLQDNCSLNENSKAPIIGMYPPSSELLYVPLISNFLELLRIPKFDVVTQIGPTYVYYRPIRIYRAIGISQLPAICPEWLH